MMAAFAWAWNLDLPCHEKFVLVVLADGTGETGLCYGPSIQRLSQICGLSEKQVESALRRLGRRGHILARIGADMYQLDWQDSFVDRREKRRKDVSVSQRRRIMERDGYRCKKCGTDKKLSIDHVVHDGQSDDENLQVLCVSCNRKKRQRSNEDFMKMPLDAGRQN